MTRLQDGAVAMKITTIGLLSILLAFCVPFNALSAGAAAADDDVVDIKTIAPAAPRVQPVAPQVQATPLHSQATPLKFSPEPGKGPQQSGNPAAEPVSSAAQPKPASSGATGSPALQSRAAGGPRAVAPPEVTEPQQLALKQPAGATGPYVAGKLVDRRDTYLPTTVGTVQIRRPFKLFAREELIRDLRFRDTPVKSVIAELANRGGLNILIDSSVNGAITGDLKDMTLNEAMDSVLAAAGLQSRTMANNTVVVGTMQAMTQLGLNRPIAKAFKLSYAHPYDVAILLHTSVFNRGVVPDFTTAKRRVAGNSERNATSTERERGNISDQQALGEGAAKQSFRTREGTTSTNSTTDDGEFRDENNQTSRLETSRQLRGISRAQTQEGVGYNVASTDPGSQQIRQYQETPTDYVVEQNGGGAIAIPDVKNRQVIVVGTPDDIAVAEEAIHLIDKRPRQVHLQASLIEITNQGLRQLGAQLNLQGAGLSGTLLGPGAQPLIQNLPGFGSPARPGPVFNDTATSGPNSVSSSFTTNQQLALQNQFQNQTANSQTISFPPAITATNTSNFNANSNSNATLQQALATVLAQAFSRTSSYILNPTSTALQPIFGGTTVGTPTATSGFTGLLGSLFPLLTAPVAGVTPLTTSQSGFNFLTLSKSAGGRANIATLPAALGLNLNLLLQNNKAKIVANPSILVTDNTEAMIIIADEVLHKVTSVATITSVTTNVELTKAGVFLDVLPKVTQDGFVTLRLRPQVSAPLGPPTTFGTPPNQTTVTLLSIRDVMTQEVRVKDGQTLVLGGLFREDEAAELSKVPYLSELPVMGALFRNTLKGRNRSELMLLITPKIVEDEPPAMAEGTNGPKGM